MTMVPLSRTLTVDEWMDLQDPYEGRYEILDGALVVSPSASSRHNRLAEDLADVLRVALRLAGSEATVTLDVEWRVVLGNRVREAPRPDVAIGWVDPKTDRLGGKVPDLVVEVWDAATERYYVRAKRRYWASKDARWLWELMIGEDDEPVRIEVWDLHADTDRPAADVAGDDRFFTSEPVPVTFTPNELVGWSERTATAAAELANQLAAQTVRADEEAARADRLEAQLRAAGIEPDVS